MTLTDFPTKQVRTKRKTNYKNSEAKPVSGMVPKTQKQKDLMDAIKQHTQVIVLGPAGTGKTYVTATVAADLYTIKEIDKIVILFNGIQVSSYGCCDVCFTCTCWT